MIFNYIVFQAEYVNLLQKHHHKLLETANSASLTGNRREYLDERILFEINVQNAKAPAFSDDLVELARRSRCIDAGDLKSFPLLIDSFRRFILSSVPSLNRMFDPRSAIPKNEQLKYLRIRREWADLLADQLSLNIISLLRQVDSPALHVFKNNTAPQLTCLPRLSEQWPTDENVITVALSRNAERMKELLQEEAAILGNLKRAAEAEEKNLREQMAKQGFTPQQIEHVINRHAELSRSKTQLENAKKELQEVREKARKKFAPAENDNEAVLWNKMCVLKTAGLPDLAAQSLTFLRKKQNRMLPDAALQIAEKVMSAPEKLPFSAGIVIVFFEPPAKSHAVFIPGDVVAEVDGKPCAVDSHFKTSPGTKYTIYRLESSGAFVKINAVMPENQPNCAAANLPF